MADVGSIPPAIRGVSMLDGFDSQEHYRSVAVSQMKQYMRYGPENYKEDWNQAIAISQLMALNPTESLELLLDRAMMRIEAYLQNNPDARPWEEA
jgi:hypothetical protein